MDTVMRSPAMARVKSYAGNMLATAIFFPGPPACPRAEQEPRRADAPNKMIAASAAITTGVASVGIFLRHLDMERIMRDPFCK